MRDPDRASPVIRPAASPFRSFTGPLVPLDTSEPPSAGGDLPRVSVFQTSANNAQPDNRSRCFPLRICMCLPCLPSSWTKIQDMLHLTLVLGVLASMLCVVLQISELASGISCDSPLCIKQVVSGVLVLPSIFYFIKLISAYDEQLQDKKQRHQEEVEGLIEKLNEQVAETNDLCRKVTENANDFAMGRFNDKCESFQRFLKGVKVHYAELYVADDMLKELREFIIFWFDVYSGSLINPGESPLLRGAKTEFNRCTSIQTLCDAAIKRVSDAKVAYQFQMPAESPLLPPRYNRASGSSSAPGSFVSVEDPPSAGLQRSLVSDGRQVSDRGCSLSWIQCGGSRRCGLEWSSSEDSMPVSVCFGCGRIKVLSRSHGNLLIAFLIDVALVLFEAFNFRWISLALVVINEICVITTLCFFEQIDEIAKLMKEINAFQQRSEEVTRRRDEARSNWEKVQQLHDLWLYRTLPCLSIMNKIQHHLQDADLARKEAVADGRGGEDERPSFLRLANESLVCLDRKLGTLDSWRKSGPLDERWKQSIGKQLKDCEGEHDLNELIKRLPILTTDMKSLEGMSPPSSVCSPTTSFS